MSMHDEWTDRLSDYLDGELSAEEYSAVEAHLRDCAHCSVARSCPSWRRTCVRRCVLPKGASSPERPTP